ncbi:MAG: hypothetical protein E6J61_16505 [Deltaproteobacteria bacterium]|nr:MAG: hypothetical protein E6J61_16505 [Deltaproteobacteria bacterium]
MRLRVCAAAALASLCVAGAGCDSVSCNSITPAAGSLCLPGVVQANQGSAIEVREECGLCSTIPSCETILRDGAVFLTLHSQVCSDAPQNCAAQDCPQRVVKCTLPALASGTYPLVVTGNQNYVLSVQEGGQSSCKLPAITQQ